MNVVLYFKTRLERDVIIDIFKDNDIEYRGGFNFQEDKWFITITKGFKLEEEFVA